jgi:hypothetical protein
MLPESSAAEEIVSDAESNQIATAGVFSTVA